MAAILCSIVLPTPVSMESDFKTPPAEARPWVCWFRLIGNMTTEGITADLEQPVGRVE